jgi:hypothetical protein
MTPSRIPYYIFFAVINITKVYIGVVFWCFFMGDELTQKVYQLTWDDPFYKSAVVPLDAIGGVQERKGHTDWFDGTPVLIMFDSDGKPRHEIKDTGIAKVLAEEGLIAPYSPLTLFAGKLTRNFSKFKNGDGIFYVERRQALHYDKEQDEIEALEELEVFEGEFTEIFSE